MFVFSLIALAVVAAAVAAALFSAHIPGLCKLTGAAPLLPEEPNLGRDFAASRAAGYVESADDWAKRIEAGLAAAATPEVTA